LANSGPYLRSAEVARRLGVSGKALRLYETHGLLRAERTPAGWRVYGPEQIGRLHQVIALKSFGFPLSRIAELLSGGLPDLATFLELHEQMLRREAKRVGRALRLLSAARAKLSEHGGLSSDDLMNLTKEIAMTDKHTDLAAAYQAVAARHFSPTDQATLTANGYGGMDKADADWEALHSEATRLMKSGDPFSPEAMDLARRWMSKVFEATGGDAVLTRKMRSVARETLEQPDFAAASSSSTGLMDFVAQAYGAAIAAGIMPRPDEAAG
jgi:DNA-binding transcriptional MerR regulator